MKNLEKKESVRAKWEDVLRKINELADMLGKPIDEGIKETVASFLVNEFPTRGSCEGHIEERFGKIAMLSPYVAIEFPNEPKERYIGEKSIREKIARDCKVKSIEDSEESERKYWDYIQTSEIPETKEYDMFRERNSTQNQRCIELINEFYSHRTKPGGSIILKTFRVGPSGSFYVTSEETDESFSLEEFEKVLELRREEMFAFTKFLKDKFFEYGN